MAQIRASRRDALIIKFQLTLFYYLGLMLVTNGVRFPV